MPNGKDARAGALLTVAIAMMTLGLGLIVDSFEVQPLNTLGLVGGVIMVVVGILVILFYQEILRHLPVSEETLVSIIQGGMPILVRFFATHDKPSGEDIKRVTTSTVKKVLEDYVQTTKE